MKFNLFGTRKKKDPDPYQQAMDKMLNKAFYEIEKSNQKPANYGFTEEQVRLLKFAGNHCNTIKTFVFSNPDIKISGVDLDTEVGLNFFFKDIRLFWCWMLYGNCTVKITHFQSVLPATDDTSMLPFFLAIKEFEDHLCGNQVKDVERTKAAMDDYQQLVNQLKH